jgi:hypothetical protein
MYPQQHRCGIRYYLVEQLQAMRSASLDSMNVMFAIPSLHLRRHHEPRREHLDSKHVGLSLYPLSPQQSLMTRSHQRNRDQVSVGRVLYSLVLDRYRVLAGFRVPPARDPNHWEIIET